MSSNPPSGSPKARSLALYALMVGWKQICPGCGKEKLYRSYLHPRDECPTCGLALAESNVGDGAVPFVMLISGALAVLAGFLLMFVWSFGMGWAIAGASATVMAVTLYLLPRFKSLLIAFQHVYQAEEARGWDDESSTD